MGVHVCDLWGVYVCVLLCVCVTCGMCIVCAFLCGCACVCLVACVCVCIAVWVCMCVACGVCMCVPCMCTCEYVCEREPSQVPLLTFLQTGMLQILQICLLSLFQQFPQGVLILAGGRGHQAC